MDAGEFQAGNVADALEFLTRFDSVFDVLKPTAHDRRTLGRRHRGADRRTHRRQESRKNFARADEIRAQLAAQGMILEDTKEGVRWKRS